MSENITEAEKLIDELEMSGTEIEYKESVHISTAVQIALELQHRKMTPAEAKKDIIEFIRQEWMDQFSVDFEDFTDDDITKAYNLVCEAFGVQA